MLERSDSRQSVSHPMQLSKLKVSQHTFHSQVLTSIYRGNSYFPHLGLLSGHSLFLPFSELPVQIVRPLRVKIAMYRHRGLLECQVSRPNAQVKWYKNRRELLPSKKYQLISQDIYRQLTINDICSSDEDNYTCDAGDDKTTCQLLVEGEIPAVTLITGCASGIPSWSRPFFLPIYAPP